MAFPTTLPAIAYSGPNSNTLQSANHNTMHQQVPDEVIAVATKIGTGASTPTSGKVLRSDGTGTSKWDNVTQFGATSLGSDQTTTSATFVSVTGLAVTLTTTGGDLIVWLSGTVNVNSAGVLGQIGLSLDGAAEVGKIFSIQAGASECVPFAVQHRFTGVSAASHTVQARFVTASGTITVYGGYSRIMAMEIKA